MSSPAASKRGGDSHNTKNIRNFVEYESAMILSKNTMERDKLREKNLKEEKQKYDKTMKVRNDREKVWRKKTAKSPFAVDLVAEDERIQEENRIRSAEEENRRRVAEERRERAKNDIVLKALSEFSDLEALREEKRAIMEEEARLKALLSLEKVKTHGKTDRLAAERAQRQRRAAKGVYRRQEYRDSLDEVIKEESVALRKKNKLLPSSTHVPFPEHLA
mmetsp:Transcript_8891/g.15111  ORF Transcript_8891/g.15111 Transcript_8891/m.15111 type:complete len:219 (+) Transcript_8891:92-748(+)